MDTEKSIKTFIGLGAVGIAAYLAYTQLSGEENTSIGGSGAFSGLGGSEGLTSEGIAGTSDSGISYNINLPQVDTGGISSFITGGSDILSDDKTVTSGDSIITGGGDIKAVTSKKEAVTSGDSTKAETSGSLSSSLAQVFGTEAQKTNERGDYYTTAAGGGAGAIKGQSLGQMALNILTGKTVSGQTVNAGSLPTGATTAADPKYSLAGVDVKAVLQADTAKKTAQAATIPSYLTQASVDYNKNTSPAQMLQDSGLLKSSSSSTSAATTTKKEAATVSTPAAKKVVSLAQASSGNAAKTSTSSTTVKKVIKVKK